MNRLTKRNEDIIYYTKGKYSPKTLSADMEPWEVRECMQKLAAYEDTGLEPEEVLSSNELKEINIKLGQLIDYINLEEQGRLIKLPCVENDTVYAIDAKGNIHECKVYNITTNVYAKENENSPHWVGFEIKSDIFGKTVFSSREEAYKALGEV